MSRKSSSTNLSSGILLNYYAGTFFSYYLHLEDYKNEGNFQHHCVYSNKYYGKKDSIILSARFLESPETPVETIELSLKNWQILQCYGKFNKPTEYHEQIMALVNNNSYRFTRINN